MFCKLHIFYIYIFIYICIYIYILLYDFWIRIISASLKAVCDSPHVFLTFSMLTQVTTARSAHRYRGGKERASTNSQSHTMSHSSKSRPSSTNQLCVCNSFDGNAKLLSFITRMTTKGLVLHVTLLLLLLLLLSLFHGYKVNSFLYLPYLIFILQSNIYFITVIHLIHILMPSIFIS